jgi:hypothetical protein
METMHKKAGFNKPAFYMLRSVAVVVRE